MSASTLRTVTTGEAAPSRTILSYLREDPRIEKGIAAVAGKYFTADRFLSLAVNAVKKTPLLLRCDSQSVLGAFMASAALGLEPNTIQQQAFLIPYKKSAPRKDASGQNVKDAHGNWIWDEAYDCQFQVGYRGFITLAHRSPVIKSIQAEAIHENDLFEHMLGTESFLKYRKSLKDRGSLIGAFSYVRLDGGGEMAAVLPLEEIHKIRSKSETYNALVRRVDEASNQKEKTKAERNLAETPWVMWDDDMAAKSAIKKHAKQLPLAAGDALSAAAEIDSGSEANVIDMASMADPDVARGVVQDGYEPPALEADASEVADFTPRQREAETIEVRSATRHAATRKEQPRPTEFVKEGEAGAAITYDQVTKAMSAATTLDALDQAADLIRDFEDENDRAGLEALYGQRRNEIEAAPAAKTARRASNVSME